MTSNTSPIWFLFAAMVLGLAACHGSSDAMQTEGSGAEAVSYTHLTLPTILLV